ncbi:MAG: hypothetical protein DDT22_00623 [candidate division WS2 bacterium]|nr:hypothetical protein [Candidatus Lithacetigena glycinireducens]
MGELFSGIHYSAVSKALARLKEEMVSDRRLLSIINELNSHFKT